MTSKRTLTGSSSSAIKSHNLRAVLHILLHHQHVSRVRIAQLTGLSTTTVTNLIAELLDQGIVVEEGPEQLKRARGVGRPRTALRLVPEARYAVGIHIGVGSLRVAVTDLFGRPVITTAQRHERERPAAEVVDTMVAMVNEAIARSGVVSGAIVGVGVGASGLVDPQTGVNVLAPNLDWHNVPLRDWLVDRLRLPVFVDNNVRAMALSEALFGAGQDVHVMAYVYVGVGVGAGFVVDGQLYRGGAGAGEIGHVVVLADGGAPCRCGNTGCLETLVSEPVVLAAAQDIAARDPQGLMAQHFDQLQEPAIEAVFDAARAGDPAVQAMLDRHARYMGIGLATLVNTLSPELIILGGMFAKGEDVLFPVVQQTLRETAFANLGENITLRKPTFGVQAGVVGAAALALNAFFYDHSGVTR